MVLDSDILKTKVLLVLESSILLGVRLPSRALGVVLYEMISLKRPFEGGNILALVNNITKNDPPPLDTCFSHELRKLIAVGLK